MTLRDEDEAPSWWVGTHGKLLLLGLLIAAVIALVGAWFALDGARYLTLDAIRTRQSQLEVLYAAHPWAVTGAFFGAYVTMAALSLPGATLMTLVAGAVFGVLAGTLLVSFAASIGATLAFLASRHLFRDAIERRFAVRMAEIDRGIEKDGAFYLFMLRLVPIVPFFVINLLMGLTRLRVGIFYLVTQVAMLGGTAVYVNAGTQLARTESLSDIVSPVLLASFALLGVFPWLAKRLIEGHGRRKLHARWRRPRRFERNLVVIGAGAAGLAASQAAAVTGAAVTLVESGRIGGAGLAEGYASRVLMRAAALRLRLREAQRPGTAQTGQAGLDFTAAMQRVERATQAAAARQSAERYRALGIDVRMGRAYIVDPWRVAVTAADGRSEIVTTRGIVIAAGSEPLRPELPGLDDVDWLTSATLPGLRELPRRLVVLGGGPVGCELAQCFARLGSAVALVERGERLLAREDPDIAEHVCAALVADGVQVLTGHRAVRCERALHAAGQWLVIAAGAEEQRIGFDRLLCAVGRRPQLAGYGLEELGLVGADGLQTDAWLQTLYPSIYAAGDVTAPWHAQVAVQQARYAAANALFRGLRRVKADARTISRSIFVDPEVASVGLNEQVAAERGIACEVTLRDIEAPGRGMAEVTADAEGAPGDLAGAAAAVGARGVVKVLTVPGGERILGATIVAPYATQRLAAFELAMRQRIGLRRVLRAMGPTWDAEAWQRRHPGLLRWARRYHAWRRGRGSAP